MNSRAQSFNLDSCAIELPGGGVIVRALKSRSCFEVPPARAPGKPNTQFYINGSVAV